MRSRTVNSDGYLSVDPVVYRHLFDEPIGKHRREEAECPRGNGRIQKTKAAVRTAYYCPVCQQRIQLLSLAGLGAPE